MSEFESQVAITLGIFASVIVPVNPISAACVFAALGLWVMRCLKLQKQRSR